MSNATERANARTLPETTNRRAVLGAVLAAGAVAATALPSTVANAAAAFDSELLALEAEIRRLIDAAQEIRTKRVDPFEDTWHDLFLTDLKAVRAFGGPREEFWKLAPSVIFCRDSGRDKAVEELAEIDLQADPLFDRMMALPAHTQAGRAAKVRTLLRHVGGDDWRGPSSDLDWEIDVARKMLGEFAGMSEEELANV